MNFNDIVTPINCERLEQLLKDVEYNENESSFLCDGFKHGFDIGYAGPWDCRDTSENIPLRVGNPTILWNKIMEEVEKKRFSGPFPEILFKETYIQSPIGLVPKAGNSGKTRLIFHLSYKFKNGNESVNYWTPEELCSVKYNDLDEAVRQCIRLMKLMGVNTLYYSKSDLQSAFRILGIKPSQHPISGKTFYFMDNCLPFGASISCSHFQCFSNALKNIVETLASRILKTPTPITNYLDDFLFIYFTINGCNYMVVVFINVCDQIRFPVSMEKTEWVMEKLYSSECCWTDITTQFLYRVKGGWKFSR